MESEWWARWPKDLPGNHDPSDRPTLMAPRLIELCFQTAGLWEMGVHGRMGLPLHVDQVRWLALTAIGRGPFVCRGHA